MQCVNENLPAAAGRLSHQAQERATFSQEARELAGRKSRKNHIWSVVVAYVESRSVRKRDTPRTPCVCFGSHDTIHLPTTVLVLFFLRQRERALSNWDIIDPLRDLNKTVGLLETQVWQVQSRLQSETARLQPSQRNARSCHTAAC